MAFDQCVFWLVFTAFIWLLLSITMGGGIAQRMTPQRYDCFRFFSQVYTYSITETCSGIGNGARTLAITLRRCRAIDILTWSVQFLFQQLAFAYAFASPAADALMSSPFGSTIRQALFDVPWSPVVSYYLSRQNDSIAAFFRHLACSAVGPSDGIGWSVVCLLLLPSQTMLHSPVAVLRPERQVV